MLTVSAALNVSGEEELLARTRLPVDESMSMTVPLNLLPPAPLSLVLPFFIAVRALLNTEPLNSILFPVAFTAAPKVVPPNVSVDVPLQVTVPLFIVPPLNVAPAEIASVFPLQSRVPVVIVNFLTLTFPASNGWLV